MSAVILMEACPHTDHLQWDAVEQGRRCAGVPERMDCHAGQSGLLRRTSDSSEQVLGFHGRTPGRGEDERRVFQRLPGSSRSAA